VSPSDLVHIGQHQRRPRSYSQEVIQHEAENEEDHEMTACVNRGDNFDDLQVQNVEALSQFCGNAN
jgi:hypothetical protein